MCTRNDQLKDALQKAREHLGTDRAVPYYNEAGYKNPKHPMNRGAMMNDSYQPQHNPHDLPAERPDWREDNTN